MIERKGNVAYFYSRFLFLFDLLGSHDTKPKNIKL